MTNVHSFEQARIAREQRPLELRMKVAQGNAEALVTAFISSVWDLEYRAYKYQRKTISAEGVVKMGFPKADIFEQRYQNEITGDMK